ncbi:hypothetical protein AGOR_G00149310 [Albula goreensis]|uniref:Deoxyribonuclease-2-alpha n=1 Tax=Albula goreensis TaxID=1534307 RepID=A0A8T3D7E5_9TELE|nr:hypothetical protein AGOR_G00149310 [Albula goreensis]
MTENFGFILYNDQPPDPNRMASASFGHSKGVVMMDGNTGVWLSHSTPKFPAGTKKTTFWPSSGNQNGQTFFCGTYEYSEFQNIAVQLMWHIMTSLAGNRFFSLAKYHRFGDDLYSGLLQKDLGTAIYAKSWGRMRNPLPSNCSIQHSVLNVKMVQLYDAFPITVDHSKWCVSVNISRPWTCIADMNRDRSQMSRGGGAVCTDLPAVWSAFSQAVYISEPCPP